MVHVDQVYDNLSDSQHESKNIWYLEKRESADDENSDTLLLARAEC